MNLPPAPAAYNQANEQAVRRAIAEEDARNRKVDVAVEFVLMTNDAGETGRLTIVGTTPTWTAL